MDQDVLTTCVGTVDEMKARIKDSARGPSDATARFTFTTIDDLLRTINANRLALLSVLLSAGALDARDWAHRVGRGAKSMNADAGVLVGCGLIERTDNGALLLPYREVRVVLRPPRTSIRCGLVRH